MTEADSQSQVVERLSAELGTIYGNCRRIETHASFVLLAGECAIKIKRAVRYPFLDYSTLALRKAACEAELSVNKVFAPAIYLGVVPIVCQAGRLQIGGPGEAIEWAVSMRRFDDAATLDHIAEGGPISVELAESIASAIVAAHVQAQRCPSWTDALRSFIVENDKEMLGGFDVFSRADVQDLTEKSLARLERLVLLLDRRAELGFVRHGHGDLHLGNIVLINSKPVLFDAIEFDPRVAIGDVFYELAFVLMDLIKRGQKLAANIIFNGYLTLSHAPSHSDALAALPLFLSVRAAIRAKVTAEQSRLAAADSRAVLAERARGYLTLAKGFLAPPSPRLIGIGGLSGTGKSTIARHLAPNIPPDPGAVVLRSDIERKVMFGVAPAEQLPASTYSRDVSRKVYANLLNGAKRVLAAGHSVIVDAVFADPQERAALNSLASEMKIPLSGLFLNLDLPERLLRIRSRIPDVSDADEKVAMEQARFDLGAMDWHLIDAGGDLNDAVTRCTRVVSGADIS